MGSDQNPEFESRRKHRVVFDLLMILILCSAAFVYSAHFDVLEQIVDFSRRFEHLEIDETVSMAVVFGISTAFFAVRRWNDAQAVNALLLRRNQELERAAQEIKQLRGIIPICAACKNIRDDAGFWRDVESYVRDHSGAEFTHSICPSCMKKLYPELEDPGEETPKSGNPPSGS